VRDVKRNKYRKMIVWTRERDMCSRLIHRWKNTVKMKEIMKGEKAEKKNVHQKKEVKVNYAN
jgi:hypothetical protein